LCSGELRVHFFWKFVDPRCGSKQEAGMNDWKQRMQKTTRDLAAQLRGIRTGTVDRGIIQTIRVDLQGRMVPINRLGAIKLQGDRILVLPFERESLPQIVKALCDSRLSAYALNPTTVCINVPALSVEQRHEIIRHVKSLGEDAKVSVRAIRQQARKQVETSGRGSLRVIQELTDTTVDEIERLVKAKVSELN
jgi:ribosome recycling factor